MDKIEQLQGIIDQSQRTVFFGGAGVSTESNIPDFRSSDGVYSLKLGRHFTAEQLVSRTMFERYPEDFYLKKTVKKRKKLLPVLYCN